MAFLEYLDQEGSASRRFAGLPEVRAALDRVFPQEARAAGGPSPRDIGRLKLR